MPVVNAGQGSILLGQLICTILGCSQPTGFHLTPLYWCGKRNFRHRYLKNHSNWHYIYMAGLPRVVTVKAVLNTVAEKQPGPEPCDVGAVKA